MVQISKSFEWEMGHRLMNHASKCRNLHGHHYKMTITISGPINSQAGSSEEGMLIDFGNLKRLVNETIVDSLDHSLMLWQKDPILELLKQYDDKLKLVSLSYPPTAERIVEYIAKNLDKRMAIKQPKIKLVSIELFETPNSSAIWRRK